MMAVFRDVLFLALLGFVMLVVLMLAHLRPPTVETPGSPPPGNLIVQIEWPAGWDTDVDLWTEAPGDRAVGYSNRSGRHVDLLRDDLGALGDPGESNVEFAYSRGLPDGEWTVNVHLFTNREGVYPVPVLARIGRRGARGTTVSLFIERIVLRHRGEELTVMRFTLRDGAVIDSHRVFKALRSWQY